MVVELFVKNITCGSNYDKTVEDFLITNIILNI